MLSAKWRPFCLCLNVLTDAHADTISKLLPNKTETAGILSFVNLYFALFSKYCILATLGDIWQTFAMYVGRLSDAESGLSFPWGTWNISD